MDVFYAVLSTASVEDLAIEIRMQVKEFKLSYTRINVPLDLTCSHLLLYAVNKTFEQHSVKSLSFSMIHCTYCRYLLKHTTVRQMKQLITMINDEGDNENVG